MTTATRAHARSTIAAFLAAGAVLALSPIASAQPLGAWYGTMSNFAGGRQARLVSGVLTITPSITQAEGPIAVAGDVRTMGLWPNTAGARYDLNHAPLGPTYTHPAALDFTFDGTTDGTWNYTVEVNTGDVYRLDRDWQNPAFLFNVGVTSQGGITYDCRTNSLWVANEGGCSPSGQCGVSGSATNYSLNGSPIGSAVFAAGSALLNDLAIDVDGTFWAHAGTDLYHYDATGLPMGTYPIALGADTIRGAEIQCIPAPAGVAVLAACAAARARRRR